MIEIDNETRSASEALPERSRSAAMRRGALCRCPNCGDGAIFNGYLKVNDHCPACGEAFFHHRADDAPPYFTITIVGHVVIGGLLIVERLYHPEMWIQFSIWLPLTVILSVLLLRPIKGALIGLQWALKMHGFNPHSDEANEAPTWVPKQHLETH